MVIIFSGSSVHQIVGIYNGYLDNSLQVLSGMKSLIIVSVSKILDSSQFSGIYSQCELFTVNYLMIDSVSYLKWVCL